MTNKPKDSSSKEWWSGIGSDRLRLDLQEILSHLDREQARVKIRRETHRFGKPVTVVEGLKMSEDDLRKLATKMKRKLATGGTVSNAAILLQGDQREKAAKVLLDEGFPQGSVEIV